MSALSTLDWQKVRLHYDLRVRVHRRLLSLQSTSQDAFVKLFLGMSDPAGNYSASDHALGPRILSSNPNAPARVASLASSFQALTTATTVPALISKAGLSYLGIGVGSEGSCMVNPSKCWVANTRSIWTHLVIKHADNFGRADEELKLYRNADSTSEMAYQIWSEIHRLLETSMTRAAEEGSRLAAAAKVQPGETTFLWADAIASELYSQHH